LDSICSTCGANWQQGEFSEECLECGPGAMQTPCPICQGYCESIWQRNVMDSNYHQESHWHGNCKLPLEDVHEIGQILVATLNETNGAQIPQAEQNRILSGIVSEYYKSK